jgi:5'-phosphate synthase pdxT subunit
MRFFGLDDAIRRRVEDGMKVWGTCAGAILAADDVVGEGGKLGLIRMTVKRNAFGSQLASFHSQAEIPRLGSGMIPLTFIRAPKILEVGDDVDVLLHMQDFIAMVESDDVLATVFHPELTPCLAVHRYFAEKCGVPTREPSADDKWDMTSWTQLCRVE